MDLGIGAGVIGAVAAVVGAYFGYRQLKVILEKPKPAEIWGTFEVETILGEVALYKSLRSVLSAGNIDCLDVTYFSSSLPKKDKETTLYWSDIISLLDTDTIQLRRVINLDPSDKKGHKTLWFLFDQVPKYFPYLNNRAYISIFSASKCPCGGDTPDGGKVYLMNLLLLYSRQHPDKGHVWLFGPHPKGHTNQQYIHLRGNKNVMLFQSIYNELFSSATLISDREIRTILNKQCGRDLNNDNLLEYLKSITDDLRQIGITKSQYPTIIEVYKKIFSKTEEAK